MLYRKKHLTSLRKNGGPAGAGAAREYAGRVNCCWLPNGPFSLLPGVFPFGLKRGNSAASRRPPLSSTTWICTQARVAAGYQKAMVVAVTATDGGFYPTALAVHAGGRLVWFNHAAGRAGRQWSERNAPGSGAGCCSCAERQRRHLILLRGGPRPSAGLRPVGRRQMAPAPRVVVSG